ncbi:MULTISPECIES: MarR family transcriptional regulator [Pseudomonadaceae]|uniref:MarR family transcriptional regulator n=2 Tax=Pseudomonas abyssi TaxID=170540 RepID=A0A395R9W9_9PSED|nr:MULTISPECIES: MarR family transcriptional regulator [Pseudomonadaceae]RGP56843.1 MarR family transcriptional regulator [Halopseudomonas gallaeciensis]
MSSATPSEVDQLLALDNQLCFALYAGSRALMRTYRPLLEPLGLTYPQYLVMLVLWEWQREPPEHPGVKALGERLQLDSGTLTPLLKRLESQGLIRRERVRGGDERQLQVSLTEAGSDLREAAASVPHQLMCQTGMSATQMRELRDGLNQLLGAMRE